MPDGPLRYIGPRFDGYLSVLHDDIQAFCRSYGEDPHEVAWFEYRRGDGDGAEVAFCVYLEDENGRRYVTADDVAATEIHTHPCDYDGWPAWWIPFETGSWFFDRAARLEGAH